MNILKNLYGTIKNSFFIGNSNSIELKNNSGTLEIQNNTKIGTSSNYTEIESDGSLVHHGDATCWDDINFDVSKARVDAVNKPNWAVFTTNTRKYKFAVDDYIWVGSNELMHCYKEGTAIYPHLHIFSNGVDIDDRYIKFQGDMIICPMNAAAVEVSFSSEWKIPANTPDKTHFLFEFDPYTDVSLGIGANIDGRLKRIASTGTAPSSNPFVAMLGIHIEMDMLGSRQRLSKT